MFQCIHVVGARPNFMKVAPVLRSLARRATRQFLVHTGQHYDAGMSDIFFEQLGLPKPDYNLGVGSGSHAVQTAQILMRFEEVLKQHLVDVVLVYGDVNSTVAAALVCAKLGIRTAHVEAGCRSFDRTMPEEINRLVTDQLADLLFTPSPEADDNLVREGIEPGKIHCVGNVMIDTLCHLLPQARRPRLEGVDGRFVLVTLHRPANVDEPAMLQAILGALAEISRAIPVVFPIHPRTRQRLRQLAFPVPEDRLHLLEPLGYLEFLALQREAAAVITDSGGIQEETTYLGVPCLTVRDNTERPITVELGTNTLVGRDMAMLKRELARILDGQAKPGRVPALWDGQAAERIAAVVLAE